MWEISLTDARKVCELVFTVSPLLALSFLVSDRRQFEPEPEKASIDERLDNTQSAIGFYVSFVIAIGLAAIGLIVPLRPWLLAGLMTAFAATGSRLFARISAAWLYSLIKMRGQLRGQLQLDDSTLPGGYTRNSGVLARELLRGLRESRAEDTSKTERDYWVKICRVSSSLLVIYILTMLFIVGIALLDLLLLSSTDIRQTGAA
jgi:hypothetical protein